MSTPPHRPELLQWLMTYAVIAHYRCAASDSPHIRDALMTMREHTRAEPGNVLYVVHEADDGFVLYEQYTDRAAFDAHAASAHFAEHILGVVRPRLTDRSVLFGEVLP